MKHLSSENTTQTPEHKETELEGQVERITYMNEENGYTVAKVNVPGYPEPVTIVGNLLALAPGEVLEMKGDWETHPKFGRQFKILGHRTVRPSSVKGIRKYLGSGLIRGIGKEMAARIVEKFGEETLKVIDERIDELATVNGIGRKRVKMIKNAWADQKEIRAIMIFLQEHGVGLSHATKIFKRYGQRSIAVVTQNPYRLATDIPGIGFQTADRIAKQLGFEKNSPVRAEAGTLYVLNRLAEEGNVFYPYDSLMEKCREILKVDRETVIRGFGAIALDGKIVVEDLNQLMDEFEPNRKAVYLKRFYISETGIVRHLSRLISSKKNVRSMDVHKALEWVQEKIELRLAQSQIDAVKMAVSDKVLVITGGPGTGKTTIIHAVIRIYSAVGAKIFLAAPTGRASKRMAEATGKAACTIHRLLEYSWQKGGFQRNEDRPIEGDVILLDEASMIDTSLMYHLLKAVPSGATLIMVGDSNQLPSVGPGNVLRDVIKSGSVPVIVLNEVFRQARESLIIMNAHRINRGLVPEVKGSGVDPGDFYFIEQGDPDQALNIIMELVLNRIPNRFNMDPMEDIQVLSPMHKGLLGTANLNIKLQDALNPSKTEIVRGDRRFRLNDKVMQIRNNYEKEVFNGDIGLIKTIDEEKQEMVVTYDDKPVLYDYLELDEIVLAYAISVHKSQGSEYQAIVLPILPQHYLLLQRNLIYTAVTRGKRLVIIVGSKRALTMGVKNEGTMKRYTYLEERLRSS
ncbi:MAG: ATP-dependent RecD-like DNA helicase [Deltaproteobacteria bacterium]|nr:ATP-dependent RecD-like DNA helicase [Deltaproteobacteria bacterium]MBW2343480.1 ATP-dependent RecD-like DNA helicase [Deltaproteobacteria bacterium]